MLPHLLECSLGLLLPISMPRYVKDEFEGYLKCGLLQYGFARIKCKAPGCGYENLFLSKVCALSAGA